MFYCNRSHYECTTFYGNSKLFNNFYLSQMEIHTSEAHPSQPIKLTPMV